MSVINCAKFPKKTCINPSNECVIFVHGVTKESIKVNVSSMSGNYMPGESIDGPTECCQKYWQLVTCKKLDMVR